MNIMLLDTGSYLSIYASNKQQMTNNWDMKKMVCQVSKWMQQTKQLQKIWTHVTNCLFDTWCTHHLGVMHKNPKVIPSWSFSSLYFFFHLLFASVQSLYSDYSISKPTNLSHCVTSHQLKKKKKVSTFVDHVCSHLTPLPTILHHSFSH